MQERGDAIVLIGFMGAGKSAAGRQLATLTSRQLYDTDRMVSERAGRPVAEIFARDGEETFRRMETEALERIADHSAIVVTGGGIVVRPENRAILKNLGYVVNLTADEATLFERATRRDTRPLLRTDDPRATFRGLLAIREPLYLAAADVTIDSSGLSQQEVAEAILAKVPSLTPYGA